MSQEEIFQKVQAIVAEQLSVESGEVKSDSNFQNDLGADSLDTVELVMALEEAFDIEIPDEAAEGIATVGDAVKFIEDKKGYEGKFLCNTRLRFTTLFFLNGILSFVRQ